MTPYRPSCAPILAGAICVAAVAPALGLAQEPVRGIPDPHFEVVSLRPNAGPTPVPPVGRIRAQPSGRLEATWSSLRELIRCGYGLQRYQEVRGNQPLLEKRFDIVASPEGDVEAIPPCEGGRLQLMLRALLVERFKLKIRWDNREQSSYVLTKARQDGAVGPQLRQSDCGTTQERPTAADLKACGFSSMINGRMQGRGVPISRLVENMWIWLGQEAPVLDRTGLTGLFDIQLSFSSAGLPAPKPFGGMMKFNEDAPMLFTALQEQLALRLEASRTQVPVLIVEQVVEPLEDK